ncbi:SEC-C metal-binding domain-containing protein [Kutzneria sp. 744]|uniref:SEC-C metal-binding domain-containing protein n=1 Tax=Kutzneria sp. (strain 744) TaxID=345341 RepID=UPI0018DD31B7
MIEKLGGNDPCPCGSGRRFQALLPPPRPLRRHPRPLLHPRLTPHPPRPPDPPGPPDATCGAHVALGVECGAHVVVEGWHRGRRRCVATSTRPSPVARPAPLALPLPCPWLYQGRGPLASK